MRTGSVSSPRLLIAAMLVDTLGSGLVAPFELLFGHVVVGLSLPLTGLILSIATGVAIAVGPAAGSLVDRYGPVRITVGANVLSAVGCVGLLLANGRLAFGLASFLLAAGARGFWAAYAPLIADFVDRREMERWFGRFRGIRYAGIAAGGGIAAFALLPGVVLGLRLVLALDALSFAVALSLVMAAARRRSTRVDRSAQRAAEPAMEGVDDSRGYGAVLRDRGNVALAGLNVLDTLLIVTPYLAMPVFVLDQLQLPLWLPGALAALGTAAVAVPLLALGRLTSGQRRLGVMSTASAVWAAGLLLFASSAWAVGAALLLLPAGAILLGLGEALYAPTADALPLTLAPTGLAGRYTALHQLAWGVSGTVAPLLAAVLLAVRPDAIWLALASMACLAGVGYRLLESRPLGVRSGSAGG